MPFGYLFQNKARVVILVLSVFCVGIFLFFMHFQHTSLRIHSVTCQEEEGSAYDCSLPLRVRSQTSVMHLQFSVDLPKRFSSLYHIRALGCLEQLTVNGIEVENAPFCYEPLGRVVALESFLRSGKNVLTVRIRNNFELFTIHEFDIRPSQMDLFVLLRTILLLVLLLSCGVVLIREFLLSGTSEFKMAFVFLGGVMLRVAYVLFTPYSVRAYDWQNHLLYIQYVLEHWRIPPAALAWETYQPPLYYFLAADWSLVGNLQILSLLLSIVTLGIGVWIAQMLFTQERQRLLFISVLAVFPGLVFFASRISNDVLLQLLAFAAFALLLRWWQRGERRDWIAAIFCIALAMLTKSNALLLLPVAFLCLLFRKGDKKKLLRSAVVILLLLTGWYYGLRFGMEGERSLIGNVERHHPQILMQDARSPSHFLVFNPLRVLTHPYNNQWEDESGRKFFWEYFLRSMYFGDFHFGQQLIGVSIVLLFLTMLLFPIFIVGVWKGRRTRESIPLLIALIVLLLGHMVYRLYLPQASTQDFRFSILLIVPFVCYLVKGLDSLSGTLRTIGQCCVYSVIILCVVFVLGIHVYS